MPEHYPVLRIALPSRSRVGSIPTRPYVKRHSQDAADAPPVAGPVTEHLANERTFLAWIRTSIAVITLGFVIAKFSVWLRQFLVSAAASTGVASPVLPASGASLPAGLALMTLGAAVAMVALWRHRKADEAIARGEYHPSHGLSSLLAVAVLVVALALVAYLFLTNRQLRTGGAVSAAVQIASRPVRPDSTDAHHFSNGGPGMRASLSGRSGRSSRSLRW